VKKKLYALLFVVVLLSTVGLLVSLLVGLNHSGRDVTDRMDLVPETANLIGHVELGEMTGEGGIADIYSALPKDEGDPQTIEEALEQALNMSDLDLSVFRDAWIFSDVSRNTADGSYCGAILRGDFDQESLMAGMGSVVGDGFTSEDYQGYTVYARSDQRVGLAFLTSDILVTGSVEAVKDVIAVQQQNMPAVSGELLDTYDDLDGRLVEMAAVMPPGMIEQEMQELTAGITSPTALDALADVEILTLDMSRDGESIDWDAKLYFSNKESANDVRGLIPLLSLVIGAIDLPGGSVVQHPENVLSLLPQVLTRSEFRTDGSCLTISSDLTLADIDAMSAVKERTGLDIAIGVNTGELTADGLEITIDGVIHNTIALKLELGEVRLAATMGEQSLMNETLRGGSIDANSTSNFQHSMVIPLEQLGEGELQITVDTAVEARGFSIPLSAAINLTTPEIASLIVVPEMDMAVDFGDLTADGLHIGLQTVMTNTNPFGIEIGDVQIAAAGESGNVLFTSEMKGLSVGAESTGTITGELLMPLDMLNEPVVIMTIRTEAGFAGVTLPMGAKITVNMPDMESLIVVPTIDVGVDMGQLTADGLTMGLRATVTNANPFGIDVGDVQIAARDGSGNAISGCTMDGVSVGPGSTGTLTGELLMPLDVLNESAVVITFQTQAGFGSVTLPIGARLTVNMPDIQSLIAAPGIDLGIDFGEATSDGLRLGLKATITNPNLFGIDIGDVRIVATGQSGRRILTERMDGCHIAPDDAGVLRGSLLMPLDILDESAVIITMETEAGFAGVSLPISARMTVNMPDLGSLVSVPRIEMSVEPSWVADLPLPGLRVDVGGNMTNEGSIDLNIDSIQASFYDSKGEYVVKMTVPGGTIGAHSSRRFSGAVTLSALQYSRLLGGGSFTVALASEARIADVKTSFPFEAAITIEMSSLVKLPEMDFGVDFGELTADGLHLSLCTNLSNCNPFGIDVGDLLIVATNASGKVIGTCSLNSLSLEPNSAGTLSGDLLVPLEELNQSTIVLALQARAGFAGTTQPINGKLTIKMPNLERLMGAPEMDLGVDFKEITPEGLHLGLRSNVSNPNAFGIDIGDLQVTARDQSGETILTSQIKGGRIAPDSSGAFSGDLILPLDRVNRSTIAITVQTHAGFSGVSMPLSGRVMVMVPGVESLISVPEMDLGLEFGQLTSEGLYVGLQANLTNSNPFSISMGDLQITARGQEGSVILATSIKGRSMGPGSRDTFSGRLLLPLEAIDEPTIVITVQAQAELGGVTLMPIKGKVVVKMPGLKSLVTTPEVDLGVAIGKITPDGLRIALEADVTNPNPFGLGMGRLHIVARGQSGDVILTSSIDGCTMGPGSNVTLRGSLLLPLEAMDEPTIVISVQTEAECNGITLAVNAKVILVNMPDVTPDETTIETTDNTTDA
jgi:hypothetical protein